MITLAPHFRYLHENGKYIGHFTYMSDPKRYNHETVKSQEDPLDTIPRYCDPKWTTLYQAKNAVKIVELSDVLKWIRTDARLASICEAIRSEPLEAEQQHMKKMMLPVIYWGEFDPQPNKFGRYKVTDDGMRVHGGVLCFDADKLTPEKLNYLINALSNDPYTYAGFVSPRGNGYKWLVRVPPVIAEHRPRYKALQAYYKRLLPDYELDSGCINESRRCFLSSDPGMIVNEDSWMWMDFTEPKPYNQQEVQFAIDDVERVYNIVHSWYKNKPFNDGQRHHLIVSITLALNDRGVPVHLAKQWINRDFVSRMPANRWAKELSDIESLYADKRAQFGSVKTEDFNKKRDAESDERAKKMLAVFKVM